ncbi:MAG: T9SS type A sorting domain-containing protein [Candidatus Kapabacteria bacterium]|nr:T9SS type A sorting domain-containing protein [Candidatus Kapabacteria bacterium]
MKKKFSVNLIGSVFLAIMIYFFAFGAETANAECDDVTKNPCIIDIFDVPYNGEGNFLYNLYRRNQEILEKLRRMEIQIDTCNLDYDEPCKSKSLSMEECLYFRHAKYQRDLDFGFKKEVKVGDTISIDDFDSKESELINFFNELESFICHFRIIVDHYSPNDDDYFEGTLIFDSYYKGETIYDFRDSMFVKGYGSYVFALNYISVFDYTVNINNDENQSSPNSFFSQNNDELIIRLTEFGNINQVEIYDLLGICQIRAQINESETSIDISKLTSGVYIVRVGNQFSKFIRE